MKIALIAYFFAGSFFANAFPHFIKGISGERFPVTKNGVLSRGLLKVFSSSVGNVIWGMINFLIVFLLLYFNNFKIGFNPNTFLFLIGFIICSIFLAWNFGRIQKK